MGIGSSSKVRRARSSRNRKGARPGFPDELQKILQRREERTVTGRLIRNPAAMFPAAGGRGRSCRNASSPGIPAGPRRSFRGETSLPQGPDFAALDVGDQVREDRFVPGCAADQGDVLQIKVRMSKVTGVRRWPPKRRISRPASRLSKAPEGRPLPRCPPPRPPISRPGRRGCLRHGEDAVDPRTAPGDLDLSRHGRHEGAAAPRQLDGGRPHAAPR